MSRNFFSNVRNISRLKELDSNYNLSPRGGSVSYPSIPRTPDQSRNQEEAPRAAKSERISDVGRGMVAPSSSAQKRPAPLTEHDLEVDAWRPAQIDEGDEPLQDPYIRSRPQESRDYLEMVNRGNDFIRQPRDAPQQQDRRRRHFIDRQETAERLEFDDLPEDSQEPIEPVRRITRKRKLVHPGEEAEDPDNGQDDAFETDNRRIDTEAKRRQAPVATRRDTVRATPIEQGRDVETEQERKIVPRQERLIEPEPRRVASALVPPRLEQDDGDFSEDPGDVYARVQAEAKRQVAMRVPAKVQTRRKWTPEETSLLIRCIQKYGTAWARIEEDEPLLRSRGQVGLKDKARNIKFDYLKAELELPPMFEYVSLSKIQINRLKDLGIDYTAQ